MIELPDYSADAPDWSKYHEFRTITCGHCGHSITVAVPCAYRFCPICGKRRHVRTYRALRWLFSHIQQKDGSKLRFITLTITSKPDANDAVKHLISSFRRLRQQKRFKRKVDGGASVIEIHRGPHGWHAHIHAVISASFYDKQALSDDWKRASGSWWVGIKLVYGGDLSAYLTKYVTSDKIPNEDRIELSVALKGTRMFTPFGSWHNYHLPKDVQHAPCRECGKRLWMLLDRPFTTEIVRVIPSWNDRPKPKTPWIPFAATG